MNQVPPPPQRSLRRLRFDASPCQFPRAAVPMLAPLDRRQLDLWRPVGTRLAPVRTEVFLRGRYGLHEAFRRAGLGPGRRLLAPSYHCPTMVDPALQLGADITLYPLHPDLSVDLEALRAMMQTQECRGGCLLLTHFFGIPQAPELITALQALCRAEQVTLIEDCSHCLALGPDSLPEGIGRHGDFAVSSPYKFIPVPEMGLLWAGNGAPVAGEPPRRGRQGWRQAAQLLRELAGTPGQAPHQTPLDPPTLAATLPAREWEEDCIGISSHYLPAEQGAWQLPLSDWVLGHTPLAPVAQLRRHNFERWQRLCQTLPQLQPLHPSLPEACVPYMFPVLLDAPELNFARLKHAGLPIWRWDDELASDCPTARRYRLSLLHLPCHQGLSEAQWRWMADTLRACLAPKDVCS